MKVNPNERCNLVAKIFFYYTYELFKNGFKNGLRINDLYEVLPAYESIKLGDRLQTEWLKCNKSKCISVYQLIMKSFGWNYLLLSCSQIIDVGISISNPWIIGKLVSYYVPGQSKLNKLEASCYGVLLVILNFIRSVYINNCGMWSTGLAIKVRTALCSFIYRQSLRMSSNVDHTLTGKILTLFTSDVNTFEKMIEYSLKVIPEFLKMLVIFYFLYERIGITALVAVVGYTIYIMLQIFVGIKVGSWYFKKNRIIEKRLQITKDVLSAVKTVKMYTWQEYFKAKIDVVRKNELGCVYKMYFINFLNVGVAVLIHRLTFFLIILMNSIWKEKRMNVSTFYYVVNCFQIITAVGQIMLPVLTSHSARFVAALKRFEPTMELIEKTSSLKPDTKSQQLLNELKSGLTVVLGPVGSGKSNLLKSFIENDMKVVSYAPQEPWLLPASVKENIVFAEKYDENRYRKVLKMCALDYDLRMLQFGDETVVADHGNNLSKGQQARINLARAMYRQADIYLLDSCFSYLDTLISDSIFKNGILHYLKHSTVVLVTDNVKYVNCADYIISSSNEKFDFKKVVPGNQRNWHWETEEIMVSDKKMKQDSKIEEINKNTNEYDTLIAPNEETAHVYKEYTKTGNFDFNIYRMSLNFGGGFLTFFATMGVFAVCQFATSYTYKLNNDWVHTETQIFKVFNSSSVNETTLIYQALISKRNNIIYIYICLILFVVATAIIRNCLILDLFLTLSKTLHRTVLRVMLNARMEFFDNIFIGNILNRLSKDLDVVDRLMDFSFFLILKFFFDFLGVVFLVASVNIVFLAPTAIFFVALILLRTLYIRTGRDLKRLDSSSRGAIVGHISSTLEGLAIIKAFKAENKMITDFNRYQNIYTSASFSCASCLRALTLMGSLISTLFIALVIARFIIFDKDTSAANVGLAISQSFTITSIVYMGIMEWARWETLMTSIERLFEYTNTAEESTQGLEIDAWPKFGEIVYQNVYMSYVNNSKKYVLKNINFTLKPHEKLKLVGRTGSGKSSSISALFRLYDIQGQILIDGINIKTLSLDFLRSKISVIPQDPLIFPGSVRENIDPLNKHDDKEIWTVVELTGLKIWVFSLDDEITENSNFSYGQKQLLCLCRVLLSKSKIVIFDELVERLDQDTVHLINSIVKKHLSDCTILTIAHNLNSIENHDKVIVLDDGEIIECGNSFKLLQNKKGTFYQMKQ